jgi:hypothetical protein
MDWRGRLAWLPRNLRVVSSGLCVGSASAVRLAETILLRDTRNGARPRRPQCRSRAGDAILPQVWEVLRHGSFKVAHH